MRVRLQVENLINVSRNALASGSRGKALSSCWPAASAVRLTLTLCNRPAILLG